MNRTASITWFFIVFSAIVLAGCDSGPPQFVSMARLVSSGTINVQSGGDGEAGAQYRQNRIEFFGTQMELIRSGEVRRRAQERVKATHPDLAEIPVALDGSRTRESSIINVQAVGEEPEYTQVYLDAVLDEFVNFRREMKEQMTDSTLNQITEELLRLERELKARERELKEFHAEHNIVLLESDQNVAGEALRELQKRKLDLEIQSIAGGDETGNEKIARELNAVEELSARYKREAAEGAGPLSEFHRIATNLERTKSLYENLLKSLRELDLSKSLEQDNVSIMERASVAVPLAKKGLFGG